VSSRVAVFALLAAALAGRPAPSQQPPRAAATSRLDSVSRAFVAGRQAPGLSVFVLRGSDTLLLGGYGYANLEDSVPTSPRTVFRIGSLTKQFTAALVMQLVQDGRISLDDTIQRFLPSFPTQGHRVTIRHLLTHTSGIRDYTTVGPEWQRVARLDLPHDSVIALFAARPFDFAPGERFLYDNSGYYLLGMILERVSGRTYDRLLGERLSGPLGLAGTLYCFTRPLIARRAQGYSRAGDGFVNSEQRSMVLPFAAGGMCSTAPDMVAWTRALWAGHVVQPAGLTAMTTSGRLASGTPTGYGFGLAIDSLEGHLRVSHGGGISGFTGSVAHFPADSLTVAVLDNSGDANASRLATQLARVALGIPLPVVRNLALSAAERALYVGDYSVGPMTVRVREEGGRLTAQAPGRGTFGLLAQGRHVFVASYDEDVRFEFQVAGERATGFTLYSGGMVNRATRAN